MADDPSTWGAIPAESAAEGPAAWGAIPAAPAGKPKDEFEGQSTWDILAGTWPGRLISDVVKSASTPYDALTGKFAIPPGPEGRITEEEVERARWVEQEIHDRAAAAAGVATGFSSARAIPRAVPPGTIPPRPQPGPLGVTLSEGQATGDLATIQREQAALRGTSGAPAQRVAQEFADQQAAELAAAHGDITKSLDTLGQQIIAAGPQEAGEVVAGALKQAERTVKGEVKAAYKEAQKLGGEIHPQALDGIGDAIRTRLDNLAEPVRVDEKLTPHASAMIDDIEKRVAPILEAARATPNAPPGQLVGINLEGVDQMRRRLSTLRKDAFASGNRADGRAARAVLDAFDEHIDQAVNGGMFSGDPRAVKAWNDARAANADYRSTFFGGKTDPIGKVVAKILGDRTSVQQTGNDVADHLFGSTGVNPNSLKVGVATRVKSILGEQSPEWVGAKQGLFSRLTETPPGVADWGPGKVANRLNQFLNGDGKELSRVVFSQEERALLQRYADLMRQLEVPRTGANWSNTATFMQKIGDKMTSNVAAIIGGFVGHSLGLPFVGEVAGMGVGKGAAKVVGRIGEKKEAREISGLMPSATARVKQWQEAVQRAQANPGPLSRAAVTTASANLGHSLERMGINLPALQSPVIGTAQENKDQVPRPPGEQNHGGAVENEQPLAQGGHVVPLHEGGGEGQALPRVHPGMLKGAKQAKDGKWYMPDSSRPGKFLRVDSA